MKKKGVCLLLLSLCLIFSVSGCRKRVVETETETTTTEAKTEKESETEKETKKQTEKTTETDKKTTTTSGTNSAQKKTVKPSTVPNNKNTTNNASSGGTTAATQMCPYCYNQISLAPNGDGTTVYSVHVAQEKAWADTFGYGTQTPDANQTPQTEAPSNNTTADDSAQCPYCYQWYTVADGSYDSHLASHNSNLGSDYVTCPRCGNTYQKGVEYDTHYCAGAQ